jgi:hypothetical protein
MHGVNEAAESLQKYIYVGAQIHFLGSGNGARKFVDMLDSPENKFSESPDIIAKKGNDVIAIEHFRFDCSKNTRKGSSDKQKLGKRKNLAGNIYHYIVEGNYSYDYMMKNVNKSFIKHYEKIPRYKENMIKDRTIDSSTNLKTMFLIEDMSMFGSNVKTNTGILPVLLSQSYEFLSFLKLHKDVDYVLACSPGLKENHVWLIDTSEIDEYFKYTINYKGMDFLNFETNIIGTTISISKNLN